MARTILISSLLFWPAPPRSATAFRMALYLSAVPTVCLFYISSAALPRSSGRLSAKWRLHLYKGLSLPANAQTEGGTPLHEVSVTNAVTMPSSNARTERPVHTDRDSYVKKNVEQSQVPQVGRGAYSSGIELQPSKVHIYHVHCEHLRTSSSHSEAYRRPLLPRR